MGRDCASGLAKETQSAKRQLQAGSRFECDLLPFAREDVSVFSAREPSALDCLGDARLDVEDLLTARTTRRKQVIFRADLLANHLRHGFGCR